MKFKEAWQAAIKGTVARPQTVNSGELAKSSKNKFSLSID